MNGLLIVVGILFLICVIVGFSRGFIKIAASLAATIISIVLVMFLTPYVSDGIREIIPLEDMVREKCMKMAGVSEENINSEIVNAEIPREQQIEAIEKSDMPEIFRDLLLENNNSEIYQMLGVDAFWEYVGKYLAKLISDIAAFLITMLVVMIVVRSVVYALGLISDLPVIGGLNRIAGGLLGMGTWLAIVWVLFIVITLFYDTAAAKICFENIEDSQLLTFLYEKNILLNFITKFR